MAKFTVATVLAVLLFTTPVFAQTTSDPGTITMDESGYHQSEMLATGRITELDLSNGTVTLDTGMQLTLSPALQYTSFPAVGEDVQITYFQQGDQDFENVAQIIDVGGTRSQGLSNQ